MSANTAFHHDFTRMCGSYFAYNAGVNAMTEYYYIKIKFWHGAEKLKSSSIRQGIKLTAPIEATMPKLLNKIMELANQLQQAQSAVLI